MKRPEVLKSVRGVSTRTNSPMNRLDSRYKDTITEPLMTEYDIKADHEKQRNKTLSNLMMIFKELQIVTYCNKEDRAEARKELIKWISGYIGVSKRTAYDYVLAIESILESSRFCSNAKDIIMGGRRKY